MRYHIFATDYDGTLARDGKVTDETVGKLYALKSTGRKLILVTGREIRYLIEDFPQYQVFDHIVAENGAVLHDAATGKEILLGDPPDSKFVRALQSAGVSPLSVGQVIVATWEPHESTVLLVIKELGIERQVIFNKAAVMILPAGINKATGLAALLKRLNYSLHNVVAVGDAENDSAMLNAAECGVAVSNALPALKEMADYVTRSDHEKGVVELVDKLSANDLESTVLKDSRRHLELGKNNDGSLFYIHPYRSGILLSGESGGGKTTFTLAIIESLIKNSYQFCLIDPEGDYLDLKGAQVIGNETSLPPLEELISLLREPEHSLVICILSIPLKERPIYFSKFLMAYSKLNYELGHPHWLLLDEAHHLLPADAGPDIYPVPVDFRNFILITTSVDKLSHQALCKTGMLFVVGNNWTYPVEQYATMLNQQMPDVPAAIEGQMLVWDRENKKNPFQVQPNLPQKLLKRHKRKYAQGDMAANSFTFTGLGNKMHLVANNVIMFKHLAEGIDPDTWLFHLKKNDYAIWFRDKVHDKELAGLSEMSEDDEDGEQVKKNILKYIDSNYTI